MHKNTDNFEIFCNYLGGLPMYVARALAGDLTFACCKIPSYKTAS